MSFKAGDKVRYKSVAGYREWAGLEGTVHGQDRNTKVLITKSAPGLSPNAWHNKVGDFGFFITENLELVKEEPKNIGFSDIQKGDTVRRTTKHRDGTTVTIEGKAYRVFSSQWITESGYTVAFASETEKATIELIERPKPEPKLWTAGKPVGSVGIRKAPRAENWKLFRKTPYGWEVEYITSGIVRKSYSDEQLAQTFDSITDKDIEWLK